MDSGSTSTSGEEPSPQSTMACTRPAGELGAVCSSEYLAKGTLPDESQVTACTWIPQAGRVTESLEQVLWPSSAHSPHAASSPAALGVLLVSLNISVYVSGSVILRVEAPGI